MEGLIPMVFRAVRKTKTRRQYECLSSGASQSYNIADFYVNAQNPVHTMNTHSTEKVEDKYTSHHRRHKSVGNIYVGYSSPGNDHRANNGGGGGGGGYPPKKLVRFRSQRMFSCITGSESKTIMDPYKLNLFQRAFP